MEIIIPKKWKTHQNLQKLKMEAKGHNQSQFGNEPARNQ
jgi:hypothetical protein